MNAPTDRLLPGDVIAPFHLDTLAHGRLGVPAAGLLHLQFRRFAGCPVCNLHLREFAERWDEISAAGVMQAGSRANGPSTVASPFSSSATSKTPTPSRTG